MSDLALKSLPEVLSFIVDNRGRSCPAAEEGLPLIATNCLKAGSREPVFENVRYVSDETRTNWFRSHPEPGDILFVCKGSPGRVAVVPNPVTFCIAQDMVALRADRKQIDPTYLYYRLTSPDVQNDIGNLHVGTMIPHFKKGDFGKLRFRIHASLAEQRGIAEVLGALDDKIAANAKIVEVGEALAGALIRDALADGQQPLGSIAAITMGSSPPGSSYNEVGEGMVFYQGVRDFGVRSPSNRVWTTEPVRVAEAGDTLVSVRAPVGRTNVATETTCLGRGLAGLRSQRPATVYHLLRSVPEVWAPYEAEGTVFGSINKAQLDGLSIPVIESTRADALEIRLAALDDRVASALNESMQLAATRDALLPLLMSGKVTVKHAESVVGEVL